jgi:O-antigen ligase
MTSDRGRAARVALDRSLVLFSGGFCIVTAAVLLDRNVAIVAVAVASVLTVVAWRGAVLGWPPIAAFVIAVVLFVPLGRYRIPIQLPLDLAPYQVVVGIVLACWAAMLLVDPAARLRRTPFDIPVAVIVLAVLGSVAVNPGRVSALEATVLKSLIVFLGFVLLYYWLSSIIRSRRMIETLTKVVVAGTAVVSALAIVEQRTGSNIFDRIGDVVPFLQFTGPIESERLGLTRAIGSASHPIELGVLLAMVLPLGLALSFSVGRRWAIPTGVLAVGTMASVSRTPLIALGAAGLVLLWLQPNDLKRLLPLLVPLIVVVRIFLPGSIATVKDLFFPEEGIVAQNARLAAEADPLLAGGRLRVIRPSLEEASRKPLLGEGYGTRQTGFLNPLRNAPILDNQWLGLLLEAGIVGVAGWIALFAVAARRLGRASRRRASPEGWLAAGFAAAIVGFGTGMLTFDALAFSQVTLVFWVLLALAASLLLCDTEDAR